MAETVHINIPDDDWVDLSNLAATLNGRVSNSGNAILVYVQAATKPNAASTKGHRLVDENLFDYIVVAPETVWIRALNSPGIASVTPGLAALASGGTTPVSMGVGDLTVDVWGTPKISIAHSLFHGMFTFDVPPSMWFIEEDGVEVLNADSVGATSANGALVVNTAGLTSVTVNSKRHPRYQPNRGHLWSSALILPGKLLNGVRDFGLFGENNGVFFRLKSDGNLYAVLRSGGVETHEELITIPDTFVGFDVEKGNIYDIRFQWRAVGDYFWYIGNPATGASELVHRIYNLGTLTALSMENPSLMLAFKATNTTEDVTMLVGCADVSSENGSSTSEQYGEASAEVAGISVGDGVLAVRNPLLAPNGEMNTRDLRLARIIIGADKKSVFKVYQTRDATAVVGGTWLAAKTGSFVESNSTITSVDVAKMEPFTTFRIAAGAQRERENPSQLTIDFFGIHGDYLVIVCTEGSSVLVDAAIEYGEEI